MFNPSSILVENYRYLLYKCTFSHLVFHTDVSSNSNKIELSVTEDPITHTVKEVLNSGCYSNIVNDNIVRVLLDRLCSD